MPRSLIGILATAALAVLCTQAQGASFNGFNERFNLGLSARSGAVCSAARNFEDPLISKSARVWDVTCRGWSQKLGRIYVFSGGAPQAWRTSLASRASCAAPAGASIGLKGATAASCKSTPSNLDYVVLTASSGRGAVVAEGMGPISDVLATGLKFVAGAIPEPPAVAEQAANVSQAAGGVGELAQLVQSRSSGVDSLREEAYRRNQDWRFNDAEDIFAELAASSSASEPAAVRVEAAYNFALNVSNEGRFAEADIYFRQADDMARQAGLESSVRGVALNYKAAHARNQGHYEEAAKLAEDAIAARRETVAGSAVSENAGVIKIADTPTQGFSTFQLTAAQRAALLDVQALQIEATSQEVLGHTDQARSVLQRAVAILDRPIFDSHNPGPARARDKKGSAAQSRGQINTITLGNASPWLNARIKADVVRLDRNQGEAQVSTPQFQLAIDAFRKKYPSSLPLAGFLLELGRAEAAVKLEDKALADYEEAFSIFRAKRGALGDSARLVGAYFDILLLRIGDAPAQHPQEVERFFLASQTLAAQASAEAAKRQAARVMSGDTAAAGLARALDDTTRSVQAKQQEIRDLQQRGAYQGDVKIREDAQLQDLVNQSNSLEAQLLQADPKYASSLRNVVSLDELQKQLRPGEVYAKIFTLANRSYGLLITPTTVHPYGIELSSQEAETLVDGFRKPMDRIDVNPVLGRFDVALAHQAFVKLFGPVQSDILGAKLIIYEPDATFLGAPISALVVDDATDVMKRNLDHARSSGTSLSYVGVHWLGMRTPSAVALSPSAFVEVRKAAVSKAPQPFFGFGDPQITENPRAFSRVKSISVLVASTGAYCNDIRQALFRLKPLPQSADEVEVVAKSLGQGPDSYRLGAAFTDKAVRTMGSSSDGLARYRVLYFATHGVLPPPNGCLQPSLVTSLAPDDGDGLIDVNDIPQLKLDADIVVLSACNTGRTQGGDDAAGLVSTFVEAGARNVVVSNWSADSAATGQLMTTMFAQKGVSQADALDLAQKAMMESPNQYSHPFYWATFTVVGDGARPMPGATS